MVVQRKKSPHPQIDFGKGAFSGFSDFRYGGKASSARVPSISIQKQRPVLSQSQRKQAVDRVAPMMKGAEPSPWAYEGPAREGLRMALVEAGNGWQASDSEAERILAAAFAQLGKSVRPSWDEGQRHTTTGPDQCLWCFGPLDDEDRIKNRRFCSPEHARAALVHWDYEGAYNLSPIAWHAGYILRLDRAETKLCLVCDRPFKATSPNTRTCSKHCAGVLAGLDMDARNCARCGESFQPSNGDQIYCGERCLHLSKEERKKKKRHAAIAEQPERCCEHCGKGFRPQRVGRASDKYCSTSCQKAAAYQRAKARAAATT